MFVPLQSEKGKALIEKYKIAKEIDSIILIAENSIYFESEAVMKIARQLSVPWTWFQIFSFVPLNMRDKFYKWIARNRFSWFGKRKTCRVI